MARVLIAYCLSLTLQELSPAQPTVREEVHRQADLGFGESGDASEKDAGTAGSDRARHRRGDRLGHLHRDRHGHLRTEVRYIFDL